MFPFADVIGRQPQLDLAMTLRALELFYERPRPTARFAAMRDRTRLEPSDLCQPTLLNTKNLYLDKPL